MIDERATLGEVLLINQNEVYKAHGYKLPPPGGKTLPPGKTKEIIPFKIIEKTTTQLFLRRLLEAFSVSNTDLDNTLLPTKSRFHTKYSKDRNLLVIEEQPQIRNIKFDINFSREKEYHKKETNDWEIVKHTGNTFKLAFPYVVFLITYDPHHFYIYDVYVYVRTSPLTSLSDPLYSMPLPNIQGDGKVCLGSEYKEMKSLQQAADSVLNRFWLNSFNTDYYTLVDRYFKHKVKFLNTVYAWQQNTKNNPLFVLTAKWLGNNPTILSYLGTGNPQNSAATASQNSYSTVRNSVRSIIKNLENNSDVFTSEPTSSYSHERAELHIDSNIVYKIGDKIKCAGFSGVLTKVFCSIYGQPRSIVIETGKDVTKTLNWSDELRVELKEQGPDLNSIPSLTLENGTVITPGDLLRVQTLNKPSRRRQHLNILHNIYDIGNGMFSGQVGPYTYILNNLKITKFDPNKLTINNKKPFKTAFYRFLQAWNLNQTSPFYTINCLKYIGLEKTKTTGDSVVLNMMFRDTKTKETVAYPISTSNLTLPKSLPAKAIKETEPAKVFRNNLYIEIPPSANELPGMENTRYYLAKGKGVYCNKLHSDSLTRMHNNYSTAKCKDLTLTWKTSKKILTRFFVPGYDFDIDFRIGDRVAFADWGHANRVTDSFVITNIIINSFSKLIFELTHTATKAKKSITYAHLENGIIFIGKLRHYASEYGVLKAGQYIQAYKLGICMFPKKLVSEIKGFITDTLTGEPMVLCSNNLTLWYEDVVKFFHIHKQLPTATKQTIPLADYQIPPQIGDLYYRDGERYVLMGQKGKITQTLVQSSGYNGQLKLRSITKSYISRYTRYGFVAPRILLKYEDSGANRIPVLPDFHGNFVEHENSPLTAPKTHIRRTK